MKKPLVSISLDLSLKGEHLIGVGYITEADIEAAPYLMIQYYWSEYEKGFPTHAQLINEQADLYFNDDRSLSGSDESDT